MEATLVRTQPAVRTAQVQRINFNGYVALRRRQRRPIGDDAPDIIPINNDRANFYACLYDPEGKPTGWEPADEWMTPEQWDQHWRTFCEAEDAKGQHETQRDALAA